MAEPPDDIEHLHERWRQGDRDDLGLFAALRVLMRVRVAAESIWAVSGP